MSQIYMFYSFPSTKHHSRKIVDTCEVTIKLNVQIIVKMHSSIRILAMLSTLFIVLDSVKGVEEKSCKQILSELTKRQLTGIGKCTKSMKFKNAKDKAAKMNCILKCVMSAEGLLSAEGKLDKATLDVFIEKEVPPSMKERVTVILDACRQKHADGLDPAEEFCKTYDPFIKCLMGAILQLCPS